MGIEEAIAKLTEAVNANTQAVNVLNAGREAALEQMKAQQLSSGEAAPKRTRAKKEEPAAAPEKAQTPAALSATDDDLRGAAQAYIAGAGDDATARQARAANLKAITTHFGVEALAGPKGVQDPEQKAQAVFFIKRFNAGCTVNFSQDYDFAGDPTQGGLDVAEPAADEFDIG